jgi:LSD1 subclass zinc finger protein
MPMQPVSCGECGAPLRVPEGVRYVTCAHCQAQLHVHSEDGVIYAQLQKLAGEAAEVRDDVAALRAHADLDRLEQEWREGEWRHGPPTAPESSASIALVGGIGGMAFIGIDLVAQTGWIGAFGVAFIAFAMIAALLRRSSTTAHDDAVARYQRALEEYESRRADLRTRVEDSS